MAEQAATVLTEAVRCLNNGVRGYYFAIAALFLFVGPYAMHRRDPRCHSPAALPAAQLPTAWAIGRYVEALKRSDEISE